MVCWTLWDWTRTRFNAFLFDWQLINCVFLPPQPKNLHLPSRSVGKAALADRYDGGRNRCWKWWMLSDTNTHTRNEGCEVPCGHQTTYISYLGLWFCNEFVCRVFLLLHFAVIVIWKIAVALLEKPMRITFLMVCWSCRGSFWLCLRSLQQRDEMSEYIENVSCSCPGEDLWAKHFLISQRAAW